MQKPIFITLLILTILMPFFWLPFNTDQINFTKSILFISLVLLALLFWLIGVLRNKKIEIKRSILDYPIIALVIIYFCSSLLSVNRYASFSKFVLILFLAIFYFLVVQVINKQRKEILLNALVYSSLLAGIIFFLPFKIPNLLGTQSALVALLAIMAPIIYKWRWIMIVLIIIILAILYIINFQIGWIVLGVGTLTHLIFNIIKSQKTKWTIAPLVILMICILSLVINVPRFFDMQLPAEVSLSKNLSWDIAFKNSTENIKQALIGSGPDTFGYAFSKFRPEKFNQNILWQIRFQRANNFWLENLATIGWLGALAWLVLFGFVFWKRKYILILPILVASVFTNFSVILLFLLFLFLGIENKKQKIKIFEIKTSGLGLGFILLLSAIIIFAVFMGRIYIADYYFVKNNISQSIKLNKYNPRYHLALAQDAIAQLPGLKNRERAEILIARAVNSSKKAVDISPNSAGFWQARAKIFNDLQQKDWAIKSYEKALELEPTNPILHQELGKLKQDLELLQKAIELKPSLSVSQYELGRIYYNQGEIDKAELYFTNAIKISPNYSNALYSLGLIYEKQNKTEQALKLFKKVLELNPDNEEVKKKIGG